MIRVASYNVENLFARPKAFSTGVPFNEPAVDAFHEVSQLIAQTVYSNNDKNRIIQLLLQLEIYRTDQHGIIRRKWSANPRWAWLRKNRGSFDVERQATGIEIVATGRNDWIGWVELAVEPTNELSVRMTAKVIADVQPNILAIVEAEDRPSLVRFNHELLSDQFEHVMLLDGNDTRGIDVGLMTTTNFPIGPIRSNVDATDNTGIIFSRDCPEYQVTTPNGNQVYVLVNHLKSQSGGGGQKRQRQADEIRRIVDRHVSQGHHVVVLGDLNEGPPNTNSTVQNFNSLYANNSPLIDVYSLPIFNQGGRPGTFDSCGIRNRLDYIFISQSLSNLVTGGTIFRQGLWGSRKSRPTNWATYPEMQRSEDQASDHALVYIDLNL